MVDNFDLMKRHWNLETEDDFYFVQLLIRSKDVPEIGSNNALIKTYTIRSLTGFEKVEAEIKVLCETMKARAYIHFTKKSFKEVTLTMFEKLTHSLRTNQLQYVNRAFNSACGSTFNNKAKTWIIDIDKEDIPKLDAIEGKIKACLPEGEKVVARFPTKDGFHLITKPFNLKDFSETFPEIDVHKNNPTILYVPKSLIN